MKTNKLFKIFRILILFLTFFVVGVYGVNAVGTAPNPVDTQAYYSMDNSNISGTTLFDLTPNNNDGTINGATTGVTGILNQALSFDGLNDYVNAPYIGTNYLSINIWVKITAFSGDIISSDDESSNRNFQLKMGTGGRFLFAIFDGTTSYVLSSIASINDNNWHYISANYNGTHLYTYVDGVFDNSLAHTGTMNNANRDIHIGSRTPIKSFLNGQIDEVGIFNDSLTPDEITYLYQTGTPTSDQQYPFGSTPVGNATLSFTNISVNGETFVNHSYLNTSNLDWYVEVLNTSTNGNVNISYNIQENLPIIITPTRPKDLSCVGNCIYIKPTSLNAEQYCQEEYNTNFTSYDTSPDSWFLLTYNGSDWVNANQYAPRIENLLCGLNESNQFSTNSLNGTFNLSLSDGNYNLSLLAENNETNVTTSLNFTVDATNPTLTFNNNTEFNTYTINLSELNITAIDSNFANMTIDWDDGNSNFTTNTTFSGTKTFTNNGNHTFNITARDLANNHITLQGQLFIDPTFYVYFNNNTANLQNFTINDIFYEEYFTGNIYDYGLGVNNFTFKKAGFQEIDFQLNFTINFTDLNQTIFTSPVFITFILKDLKNGSNAPNNNYTFFITEVSTGDFETYSITNDNTLTIENLYTDETELEITVVLNETLSNTIQVVSARQNVTLPIYINFETTSARIIEVKTSTLIAIPNNDVFVYKYIDGEGFVLETIKTTNSLGQVFINIIENSAIYNICSTYLGDEVCLNQITFQNVETDPFEIIFPSNYKTIERDELDFITWSFSENKNFTAETSQITFTFDDRQSIVQKFCIDVTRRTNNTDSYLGEFCNNNPTGQLVQTFGLSNNQRLEYIFSYYIDDEKKILSTYYSYGENAQLNELIKLSIIDILFLFAIFGIISLLLSFNNFTVYNLGFLTASLGILLIQAYLNKDFVTASIWSFLFLKTIVLYMTKGGNR